jgi:hypothetical protein
MSEMTEGVGAIGTALYAENRKVSMVQELTTESFLLLKNHRTFRSVSVK